MAVFAFTVHPDEKDVRVAISKQNILLIALLWANTGLFLIQAGITIASLTSRGVNCTPRRALDLAAVAVRVKSVGRQLAASILFLAVMAPAGVTGAQDTRNMPDEAKPPEAVPFFLLIDSEPVRLIFDSGKAFWGSKHTHRLDVWVAYRYWENKYGFDHNTSPVCMGLGAGSCVEKSIYPGITVKF